MSVFADIGSEIQGLRTKMLNRKETSDFGEGVYPEEAELEYWEVLALLEQAHIKMQKASLLFTRALGEAHLKGLYGQGGA